MLALDANRRLKCRVGLHAYGPDHDAGYPYQRCTACGKMGIYRPATGHSLGVRALLR